MGLFADMQDYHDRAAYLLKTGTLYPDAFRVPLFPIFIAGVFRLAPESLIAVRAGQALIGTGTVALTYFIARRMATDRGALVAALIVAIYPALLLYSAYIMAETLFAFFVVLVVLLWINERWWLAPLAGVAAGAATLTRSVGLALLAGMVLAELWSAQSDRSRTGARAFARVTLLILGFAVALAPWVQRNYAIYHRFVPTDTSSGFNVLLGNYPGATGRHPGLPAVEEASRRYGTNTRNDLERSDAGMKIAREFVMREPSRAARLALFKVAYLLGLEGREHAWGYSLHLQGRRSARTIWVWGVAILISFPLLMIGASIGAWRPGVTANLTGRLLLMTLASVVLLHIASFGDSRFHLPWVPLLTVLFARGVAPLYTERWSASRVAALVVSLAVLAFVWRSQAPELLSVLPRLAESPVPLQLPF